MNLLEKEKAFVAWWQNDVSRMSTTVNKLSARIAFSAGYRIASNAQQSVQRIAFGAFAAGVLVGIVVSLIIVFVQIGVR